MDYVGDTPALAIRLANQFKRNGLTLIDGDDNYKVALYDDITFFSLYEASCFIQGYELCEIRQQNKELILRSFANDKIKEKRGGNNE